MYKVSSNLII